MTRAALAVALSVGFLAVAPAAAWADSLDCTSGSCSSSTSGFQVSFGGVTFWSFAGPLWTTADTQSTGTVAIDSLVRINSNTAIEDGMSNSARPLLSDESLSNRSTPSLLASQVPTVKLPKVDDSPGTESYYQFLLDINQTGDDPLLSLSGLQLCSAGSGGLDLIDTCAGAASQSTPANNGQLNNNLNNGGGAGDLFVYIPTSLVPSDTDNKYIYLWSQFGLPAPYVNNDGYEEWAVRANLGSPTAFNIAAIPEPGTLLLLGTGLAMGAGALRRRSKTGRSRG